MFFNSNQFILWSYNKSTNMKYPVDFRTMKAGDAHDPSTWLPYSIVRELSIQTGMGIGYVFTKEDPYFFLDIDNCALPDGSGWNIVAVETVGRFPGAFVERSVSGKGLHIIGKSSSIPEHGCKSTIGIDLYTEMRFCALTFEGYQGDPDSDHTTALSSMVSQFFAPGEAIPDEGWRNTPVDGWSGPADDGELLLLALGSKPKFKSVRFSDLFSGNAVALGPVFPDDHSRPFDLSRADAALAQHLAFWTGKNHQRIQDIMALSALNREKWQERPKYLQDTISKAVSMQRNVYRDKPAPISLPNETLKQGIEQVSGFQYMTIDKQKEFFKGCCYIMDLHRVFIPSGEMLKPEQFNVVYGGYLFQIDEDGKKTTKKAWEAFTESQVLRHPKAHGSVFKPAIPTGEFLKRDGRLLVNTYVDVRVDNVQGDPGPFLSHLEKLLPNENDRTIILSYMAACVQHKGVKFQWAPFIQGVEGNGKTLLTRCVMQALGRRYTHFPKAADLDNKFNGWLLNKLLIGIEDIHVPEHRNEILETLKPMITGSDGLEIQFKGADQITADICCNFIINSNHKDALRSKEDHRRFSIFFTAQQTKKDLQTTGMGGDYFPRLYNWLNNGGYAIVTNYLCNYKIQEEYNPAGIIHRAPETSSTLAAIGSGLGRIEQEIIEAIDEGRPGFAGGWVSSVALDKLLSNNRSSRIIPLNKRREVLNSIGYDWHPGLPNGRVNNPVMIDDNKKPRLFIKSGHPHKLLTSATEIVRVYSAAQYPG